MLKEIYQYISTPCLPYVKKLGFLKEIIALEARFKRCQSEWLPHYKQCQNAILTSVKQVNNRNIIVILGAGLIPDVPLKELANIFIKVVLIDLVFLKSTREQAGIYQNVMLVEADVSNVLKKLLEAKNSQEIIKFLKNNPPNFSNILPCNEQISCVISLNLATQIPLIPVSWLFNKFNGDVKSVNELAQLLIQQHLDLLNSLRKNLTTD